MKILPILKLRIFKNWVHKTKGIKNAEADIKQVALKTQNTERRHAPVISASGAGPEEETNPLVYFPFFIK